jgi:polyisoprenoid-binding protein YceI
MIKKILFIFLLSLFVRTVTLANTYVIDQANSQVNFEIEHFKFSKVKGKFKNFEGNISFDPNNLQSFHTEGNIKTQSIDTGIKARDEHLRSAEIFNTPKFADITFEANSINEIEKDKKYEVKGKLTIKGITKPILIKMNISPSSNKNKLVFNGKTNVKRNDFGIKWSNIVEGGNLVGDTVNVELKIVSTLKN